MSQPQFYIRTSESSIEFWTDIRIPFEPKDSILDMRNVLREALRAISPVNNHILKAEFISEVKEFFDVENALIYNIGTSTFRKFTDDGLHVKRDYSIPGHSPSGRLYRYLYKYSFAPVPKSPSITPSISFSLSELNSSTKPHHIWWAMCSGTAVSFPIVNGSFRLHIQAPSASANFTNVIKPLLDGVICAMHPAANIDDDAVARLASKTGWSRLEIKKNLQNPPLPLLNQRKILSSYRNFIKWDPEDELCEEFHVVRSKDDKICRVWIENINHMNLTNHGRQL